MELSEKIDSEISYYELGQPGQSSILFIHGNSSSKEVFKTQLEHFSKSYYVLAADLPGHGNSFRDEQAAQDPNVYSINYFSDHLKKLLENKSINSLIIVGHSLGGHIAIDLSKKISDKLRGVFIINASPLETLDDIPLAFNQIPEVGTLFNKDASNEDILALKKTFITNEISTNFEETFKSTDSIFRENLFNSIQANFEIGEISTINALPCPFTLYYSKNEKILNDDYRVKLTTRIKKASFTGLEIEGHFPMLEDSIKFNKALEDNLTELDS